MGRPRKHNKHLPERVFYRHGAYYYVKQGEWTSLGREFGQAMARYAQLIESQDNPERPGALDVHIDYALKIHLKGKAANTVNQYRLAAGELKHMLRLLPEPMALRPRDVVAIKRHFAETPNYANRVVSLLREICNIWLEDNLIESNPAVGIKRFREAERERLITMAEFRAIREHAGERLQVLMDLWYLTGQRVSDVLKVQRSQLLSEGIAFKQQKTGARLIVEWNDDLRVAVARAEAIYGNRALTLLCNRRGKAPDYSTIKLQWVKACKAAGVQDAQIRDLRAMAGTDAKDQGKNPTQLLGHKTPQMTVRYLRSKVVPVVDGPRLSTASIGHLSNTRSKHNK